MRTLADRIIDALGGSTAVHRMTQIPLSTVHSWRRNGIPPARLAHLKLAAQVVGKDIDWENPAEPAADIESTGHDLDNAARAAIASPGIAAEISSPAGVA